MRWMTTTIIYFLNNMILFDFLYLTVQNRIEKIPILDEALDTILQIRNHAGDIG